jgi:GGDEF domain-containing protein
MHGRIDGLDECRADALSDRLLKVIAALAKVYKSRSVDRWEASTFAVLLDGITLGQAASILHGACDAVAAQHMRVCENDAPLSAVTIKAGVAAIGQRDAHTVGDAALRQLRLAKERHQLISIEGRLVEVS